MLLLFHDDQREYYACDATYRNWLKFELENAAIAPAELSSEEKDRAAATALETLDSSLSLLLSKFNFKVEYAGWLFVRLFLFMKWIAAFRLYLSVNLLSSLFPVLFSVI